MIENKTCWTCKFRDVDSSLKPCSECDDLLHDFHEYTKWEKREK